MAQITPDETSVTTLSIRVVRSDGAVLLDATAVYWAFDRTSQAH